jgi:hypothetical protein
VPQLELPGVLSGADLAATGAAVAAVQEPTGAIPWFPGGHTDPWDHVECAMALDVLGLHEPAVRAYEWLRSRQRPDGSWAARYEQDRITQAHTESNFCGYVAVGVWHHVRRTGDTAFGARMWPTVRAALDLVVAMQLAGGQVAWGLGSGGRTEDALLTSSSSLYLSLRSGLALAESVGATSPDWELAAGRLGHALRHHPERFTDKSRFSMDWYYPVLGGAVRGAAAHERIAARWDEFWVPGRGIRCVADRPWVTGAETCELAIALAAIGETARATEVVGAMQHLREDDGSYWTGYVYPDRARWPVERSSWTAAAVVLATDAITRSSAASGIFEASELPVGVDPADIVCADEAGLARTSSPLCDASEQA